jgi:SlyX protein
MSPEQRIEELEIRVAHLDAALQTLSDELAAQQHHQQELSAELGRLRERLVSAHEPVPAAVEPRPPHY